jgi:hypothetical protein
MLESGALTLDFQQNDIKATVYPIQIMPSIEFLFKKLDEIPKTETDEPAKPNQEEAVNITIKASVTSVTLNLITDQFVTESKHWDLNTEMNGLHLDFKVFKQKSVVDFKFD